jgi:hypothetical protein
MALVRTGTPFVGYASLVSAAAVTFSLYTVMGQAAYTLGAKERVYITNITISSGDTGATAQLITIDSGSVTAGINPVPTKIVSAYIKAAKAMQPLQIPPGECRGVFGVVPRAFASAVTTGTVELVIFGYIGRS